MEKEVYKKIQKWFSNQISKGNYYFGDKCRIDGVEYIIEYHGVGFVIIKEAGKGNKKTTKVSYR